MVHAGKKGMRLSFVSLLLAIALLCRPFAAYANPEGGVVAAGQANIITTAAAVDIHQQSDKAVIDWRGFDIAPNERTEFRQPSASAIALNRVNSPNASAINGTLKANGNIIIVNQNGVLFGKQAVVDVNGLVATTADVSNERFMSDGPLKLDIPGNPNAAVVNEGSITAKESGLVGFVAPRVENSGVITARLGRVELAAGNTTTVDFYGDGLMEVAVSDDVSHQLVKNAGTINAQGGTIALSAAAGSKLLSSAIENRGHLNAQTASLQGGRIIISAAGKNAVANNVAAGKGKTNVASRVSVGGSVDVSGLNAGEKGGAITVTGDTITLLSDARLDARGTLGGGVIRVGGEYLGRGTTPTAIDTVVTAGAVLDASATVQGHGGEVIVFADRDTIFDGLIVANAAGIRGNGGFVETSGKAHLAIGGAVEARASGGGNAGAWLLDPADITITAATNTDITGSTPFTATNTASQLSAATIVAALNGGTNVTVQTTNDAFVGNGDIFVNAAIATSGAGSLTLSAFRNITVNNAISLLAGTLTLQADNTGIGSGAVTTAANLSTTTGGITIGGGSGAITAATYNANGSVNTAATGYATGNAAMSQGVTIGGTITSTSGNIIINGRGASGTGNSVGVSQGVGNTISTSGVGTIRISGINQGTAANANQANGVTLRGNVTAQNGVIQINGQGGNGTDTTSNAGILVSSTGGLVRTTGTGAITLSGIGGSSNGGKNHGVLVNNTSGVSPTGSGTVLIFGQGGNVGANNTGVAINDGGAGSIVGAGGAITINGTGGTTAGGNNYGVGLIGSGAGIGALTNSGTGTITVNGTGAGSGAAANNYGIVISGTGANISTSGTGAISVTGTGGGGTGGNNYGVIVNSASGVTRTGVGTISITGQGGNAGGNAVGVIVGSTGSIVGGTSAVTINGTGGLSNGSSSHGVQFNGAGAGTGSLTTSGAVTITGTGGGGGTTNNNHGIFLSGTGATIAKTGAGAFTLTGTGGTGSGGSNHGIQSSIGDGITSAANATLNATAGAGAGSAGIVSTVTNGIRTTGAATLTLLSNTYNITAASGVNSITTLTVAPLTAVTFGLGTGAGVATINNASLGNIAATTGYIFGSATSGAVTVNTTAPFTSRALTFISAGNITLTNAFNGLTSLTTTAPTGITTINGILGGTTAIGAVTMTGQDLAINANLTSNAAISGAFTRDITIGAAATITNGAASALTLTAAGNSTVGTGNLTINGNLNVGTGALTLLSGINVTRPSWTITGTNLTRQGATFGATSITGFNNLTVNRDILSSGNIVLTSFRDLTLNAANTITTGAAGALTLQAANASTVGTGNLNLNGNVSVGTGTVTFRSGINVTRPNYTITATNFVPQSTFGVIDIQGFFDMNINRDITSSGNITAVAFRDLTLNALNTLTTGAAGALNLQAANGNTAGVGNLNVNGNVSVGTGTVTFRSGINVTRPSYTMTATNFVPLTTFGPIDIQGFLDIFINRNITTTGNITILSFQDLNLNAANTLTTGLAGSLTLQAANNNTGNVGNLNLAGNLSVGTGSLTLRSGANGTRPNWTATATNLVLQGATLGTVNISGFLATVFDRDLPSSAGITIVGFRDVTLNALRTITSGGASGLNIQSANGGTGNAGLLNLNGVLSNGTGGLTLLSGVTTGVRANWTATTANLIRQGATFGALSIQGFGNFIVDRVFNSSNTVTIANNTLTTLRNNITSTGSNMAFTANPIVVAEGFSPTISTTNANITFNAATIADTAGGVTEGLTISAGTGTITSNATINGVALNANGGTLALTGILGGTTALGNSTLTSTTATQLSLPTITALSLNASTTPAGSQFILAAPITTTGASGLTLTSAGSITKTGAGNLNSGTGPMALNATGAIIFANAGTNLTSTGGNITLTSPVGIINSQTLAIATGNGNLSYVGPVVVGAPLTITAGTGAVNFSSSINGAASIPTFDVLLVGGGGGGGGGDTIGGAGGGSGGVVDATLNAINGSTYSVTVAGGGGGAASAVTNTGRGGGGSNGGANGGNAGTGGTSGGGGGGGGFSGITIGGTFYGVAGGGAGGGGANEGTANDVVAPGGGSQPNGSTAGTGGGAGANFAGDGGGGGGGGGGFLGGNGQTNLTTSGQASGGRNYSNPVNASGTLTNGNNGATQAGGSAGGAAISATRAAFFGYANNAGAGGNGVITGTAGAGGAGRTIIRYTGTTAQSVATGTYTTTTVGGDTIVTYSTVGTHTFAPISGCNGGCNLTITAGNVNFGSTIGATTALGALSVNATNGFILPTTIAGSLTATGQTSLNGNITTTPSGNVSFNSPVILINNSTINAGSGTVTFANTINGANNLSVNAGTISFGGAVGGTTALGDSAFTSTNALNLSQNITASSILARTTGAASDITIAATRSLTASGAGNAITIASGRNFINNSGLGTATLNTTGGGRYLVYSVQPSSDTTGGLARDFRRFSCSYAGVGTCAFNATINNTVTIPATGNGFIYSSTPSTLTLTISSIPNVTYGDSVNLTNIAVDPTTLGQYLNAADFAADVITGSINGSTTYVPGPTNGGVGTYHINYASGTLISELGYNILYANNPTAFTVVPRAVTVSLIGTASKVYDQNTIATLAGGNYAIGNVFAGDALGISNTSGTYDTKNVGTGKTVTVTGLVLTGAPVANYVLSSGTATGNVGTITQRALTISATALNKIYDGNTTATPTLSDDRVAGDVLTLGFGAANFADKDAANGKTVTVTGLTLSNTDAGNYSFNTSTTTTADILKRGLTVTADPQSVTYGTNVPNGTISYSGFITGEDATFLATAPVVNSGLSGIQNAGSYVGNYTASGGVDGNYDFSYVAGNLTVVGKILNVTADTKTIEYGTVVPAGTLTYNGFITGQDESFLITAPTVSSNLSGIQNVGTYLGNFTPSGGVAANYLFNYVTGDLVVTRKNLNVSADNKTVNYGIAVPVGTLTYSGFIAGENATFLTTAPTVSSNLSGIQNAGSYAANYTASGGVSNNYNFIYTPGSFTVTPTGLNVTVGNRTVTYGVAVPTSSIVYTGFVLGEDETILTAAPTISSTQSGIVGAGTYAGNYTATGGVSANYSFNYVAGDLTVTPQPLNVTVGNRTVTYGVAVPTSSLTYTGFIAGEDATFLTTAPSISSSLSGVQNVGTYVGNYTATGGVSANYTFNYVAGNLVVGRKDLIVTANNQNITYGTPVPLGTLSYSGFITGEDATFLAAAPVVSSGVSGIQNAGSYAGNYTVAGGVASNYNFLYNAGDLLVSVAPLTITANAVNRVYGAANTFNGFNAVGLQNGETVGGVTLGSTATLSGSGLWNVGSWVITPSAANGGTFSPSNYAITYNTGAMVISPRALTISATGVNKLFDGSAAATVTLSDNRVAGDVLTTDYTAAEFPDSSLGSGRLVTVTGITLSNADAGNYSFNTSALTTADILSSTFAVPPLSPVVVNEMPLPNTVVKVSQDPGATVDSPADDGIYATPTSSYLLVYLPDNAPIDNQLGNRPTPAARNSAPFVSAFITPDEEKRLRNAKNKRARNLLARGNKTFIYDANIPMPGRSGGFEASPDVKSI